VAGYHDHGKSFASMVVTSNYLNTSSQHFLWISLQPESMADHAPPEKIDVSWIDQSVISDINATRDSSYSFYNWLPSFISLSKMAAGDTPVSAKNSEIL
jgi:hypothetical protein